MAEVKTLFDNKQADVTSSKLKLGNVKGTSTREDIPECVEELYNSLKTDFTQLFSADELADYLEASRQTILNYASHGILDGQRKVGDKSIYFDFEKSLLPMFLQFENKDFHEELKNNEINFVCICSSDSVFDTYKEFAISKYGKDVVFTLDELTKYGVSLGQESPDIVSVANEAKNMADKEAKKIHDKVKNECDFKVRKITEDELSEHYNKVLKEFLDLLKATNFEEENIVVDITDVEIALKAMAKTKTIQGINNLKCIEKQRYASKNKDVDKKYSMSYTDDYGNVKVGTEYEKFFKKAYRIGVGRTIRDSLHRTLTSKHVLLHTYILSGDTAEDMVGISKLFRGFKPSYKTIVMGYSVLDDTLKTVVDTCCRDIEEKGSNYSTATT